MYQKYRAFQYTPALVFNGHTTKATILLKLKPEIPFYDSLLSLLVPKKFGLVHWNMNAKGWDTFAGIRNLYSAISIQEPILFNKNPQRTCTRSLIKFGINVKIHKEVNGGGIRLSYFEISNTEPTLLNN